MSDVVDIRRLLGPSLKYADGKIDVVASAGATSVTMGGDVIGSSDAATVVKIQGIPVSATDPTVDQVLIFNGTSYVPGDQSGGGGTPDPHAASHQNGGSDEINVAGLSGVLADDQQANKIRTTTGPTLLSVGAIADGEYLKRSGSTIISGTPAGGGGSANPYIDNFGTPSALDDEFDAGSPQLALRGWTIYRASDQTVLTYGGTISALNPPTAGTYRASLFGSYLMLQLEASGDLAVLTRNASTLTANQTHMLRVGIPWGRGLSSGNSSGTDLSGGCQVSVFRSSVTVGSYPLVSGSFARALLGQGAGAASYYGYDEGSTTFLRNPSGSSGLSQSILNDVDGMWVYCNSSGVMQDTSVVCTGAGSVRGSHRQEAGGELSVSTPAQAGFTLFSANGNSGNGPVCTFLIDYFRVRAGATWYGL